MLVSSIRKFSPLSLSVYNSLFRNCLLTIVTLTAVYSASAHSDSILVQSTTSTANSGLYDHLLPIFNTKSDIKVNVVAVGTGQAIKNAVNCDADVLLVHAKTAEEKFVAEGNGVERFDLMYNDFIIVGPQADPAGIRGLQQVTEALSKIADSKSLFASRGDDSGTHKKEQALWLASGIDPEPQSGKWYRETGSGMGATLNTAVGMRAYVLTDRATWISFANKSDFVIAVENDKRLFNQYGVIPVNPNKCSNVNYPAAQEFVSWLLSDTGQTAIEQYSVDDQQLFFPNAAKIPE